MATASVLVVDDHQDILALMRAMLVRSNYDVFTADSEPAALEILNTHSPIDLVISEAVLPEGHGPELVQAIQAFFPATALMLMTAYTDGPLQVAAVPLLEKPFTRDALLHRVEEVLGRSRKLGAQLNAAFCHSRQSTDDSRELRHQVEDVRSEVRANVACSRRMRWDRQLQQSQPQNPTILVVEDDAAFRYAVTRFLSTQGYTVLDAASYDEALFVWRKHQERIAVVVTDLRGVDGLELADVVETTCPDKPIVFMTAADAALPRPTLRKPFDLGDLLSVIRRLLTETSS